jgi:hypothetical protein
MKDNQLSAISDFILEVDVLSKETHEAEDRSIYGRYLSQAAIILAKVVQGRSIGDDVATMERLFGDTWLKDDTSYSRAYSAWDRFKELLVKSIHGMTVNERLFNLGLLDEFDVAVRKRDKMRLRAILAKCFLNEQNIEAIIENELGKK